MKAILKDKDGFVKETIIRARDDEEGFIDLKITYQQPEPPPEIPPA